MRTPVTISKRTGVAVRTGGRTVADTPVRTSMPTTMTVPPGVKPSDWAAALELIPDLAEAKIVACRCGATRVYVTNEVVKGHAQVVLPCAACGVVTLAAPSAENRWVWAQPEWA